MHSCTKLKKQFLIIYKLWLQILIIKETTNKFDCKAVNTVWRLIRCTLKRNCFFMKKISVESPKENTFSILLWTKVLCAYQVFQNLIWGFLATPSTNKIYGRRKRHNVLMNGRMAWKCVTSRLTITDWLSNNIFSFRMICQKRQQFQYFSLKTYRNYLWTDSVILTRFTKRL